MCLLSRRRAHASDGEPGDALQGGTPAAAHAAEASAQEGPAGLARPLPVAAQPQGRPQQQQQQHVQRGLPGPGLRGLGVEARRQGGHEDGVRHGVRGGGGGDGGGGKGDGGSSTAGGGLAARIFREMVV